MRDLDLHGLSIDDALKTFTDFYNHSVRAKPQEPIRIVHGYGSSCEGGKIRKLLHARGEQLAVRILEFCSTARTESKIAGEFRKYDAREIKEAIRALLRQGRLKEVFKGGHTTYVRSG